MQHPDTIEEAVYRVLARPGSLLERKEAPTVRLKGREITYACPCRRDGGCLYCYEDRGTRIAVVTDYSVKIGEVAYDRGVESPEVIAEACEQVDEHCRDLLARLLSFCPLDEEETVRDVTPLTYEQLTDDRAPAVDAAMNLHDVLVSMMRVAAQESSAPFADKARAMAQLGVR